MQVIPKQSFYTFFDRDSQRIVIRMRSLAGMETVVEDGQRVHRAFDSDWVSTNKTYFLQDAEFEYFNNELIEVVDDSEVNHN